MDDKTRGDVGSNTVTVKKGDTEGLLALRLLESFFRLPRKEQAKLLQKKNMEEYLRIVFQAKSKKPCRIITICRSGIWSDRVHRYCQTPYGERSFSWHRMSDIVNAKLDEVS